MGQCFRIGSVAKLHELPSLPGSLPHIFEVSKDSLKIRTPLLILFSASEVGFISPHSFLL